MNICKKKSKSDLAHDRFYGVARQDNENQAGLTLNAVLVSDSR